MLFVGLTEDAAFEHTHETISTHAVFDAMHTLPNNKACGLDFISAEHLKNASLRLAPLLALSLTGFMIHGIVPDSIHLAGPGA